jgi:hypothetical protein
MFVREDHAIQDRRRALKWTTRVLPADRFRGERFEEQEFYFVGPPVRRSVGVSTHRCSRNLPSDCFRKVLRLIVSFVVANIDS